MRKNDWKAWLKSWDAGEFDFTQALEGRSAPPQGQNTLHPWKEENVTRLERRELRFFQSLYPVASIVLCAVIISFLLLTVANLPPFGAADAPAHNEVMERYVEHGMEETGAVNTVAGVILDYRAFDTLGESHVLYTASTAVFVLLLSLGEAQPDPERHITQADPLLRSTARIVVPLVLLYGVYVILFGHLGPGGGFSGGAVMGAGLILYDLAFGSEALGRILNLKSYRIIILCALGFYSAAKCYSFFCGANHLETIFSPGTPGMVFSAGLILPLNVAVGIVVCCTMYGLYSVFQRGRI